MSSPVRSATACLGLQQYLRTRVRPVLLEPGEERTPDESVDDDRTVVPERERTDPSVAG